MVFHSVCFGFVLVFPVRDVGEGLAVYRQSFL